MNEYDGEYLRQTFVNTGIQRSSMCDDPHAIMFRVLVELVALHGCKRVKSAIINPCFRSEPDIFSISSDDEPIFKYYISSDDEFD
jgi:hypothetical protein